MLALVQAQAQGRRPYAPAELLQALGLR